ncbi:5131_t:CDS:1, partial [Racocetra fulgida]
LRNQLQEIANSDWEKRLECLISIIRGLVAIHSLNLVHKDLHSGNILTLLENEIYNCYIVDLGLAQPAFQSNFVKGDIYGILPYIAPEVFKHNPYSQAADIYSFGVIMSEINTGKPAYHDQEHGIALACAICNGLRPKFVEKTPQIYITLANQCMNADPFKRPTASEIEKVLEIWYSDEEITK